MKFSIIFSFLAITCLVVSNPVFAEEAKSVNDEENQDTRNLNRVTISSGDTLFFDGDEGQATIGKGKGSIGEDIIIFEHINFQDGTQGLKWKKE